MPIQHSLFTQSNIDYMGRFDGFQDVNVSFGVKTIQAEVEMTKEVLDDMGRAGEMELVEAIARQIGSQLAQEKLIQVWKVAPDYSDHYARHKFQGSVRVVDESINNVIVPIRGMVWKDREWTEDDIIKALEIAYPEYMV